MVVSAPFLGAALATGAGQYAFGMFIEPLEQTFGWSRSQITASLSFTAVGALIAPFLGRIMDRYGAKRIMAVSLVLIALSYLLRPMMTELWHWYALSLFQYAGYTGASMLSGGKLVGMWFHRRRGRAMGITAMGNNFGGLVIPPMLGFLLPLVAWEGAYVSLGILSIALVAYVLVVVRDFPTRADLGAELGADNTDNIESSPRLSGTRIASGWTLGEALRSRSFYAIATAVMLGTFTYAAILPQIITHLTGQGASIAVATTVLSVFAVCGMIGKSVMGFLAERITSRYALMINFCGQAIFLVLLIWADDPIIMWTATPLFGFFNGAFGALFQLVVQDAFGVRHFGAIMGLINMLTVVSFGTGPILAGVSYDATGSYTFVFVAVSLMFVFASLALTLARAEDNKHTAGGG